MGSLVRTLLMWLLVLAVPAQGAAAVTMALCGPGHHSAAPAADTQQHAGDAHGYEHEHEHGHALAAPAADPQPAQALSEPAVTATDHAAPDSKSFHGDGHKCSACASCCAAAALPAAITPLQPPVCVASFLPLAPRSLPPFLTAGPERPPRLVLA